MDMKRGIYIILVVIVILLTLGVFFIFRSERSEPTKETVSPPLTTEKKTEKVAIDQSAATAKNYRESSEKYKYQIDVSYPVFNGSADKKILDIINSQIEKSVNMEVDKYIAEARKNKIAAIFGYLTGNYTYSVGDGNILSVKMEMEKYLSGAANPHTYSIILNYDLVSGKQTL